MAASPSELLQSRKLRAKMPVSCKSLQPKVQKNVHARLVKQQQRTERWYNKGIRKDFELRPGDKVVVNCGRNKETWEPGVVIQKLEQPRSYLIQNSNGNLVRRTLQHLEKSVLNAGGNNHFELYPFSNLSAIVNKPVPSQLVNKSDVNKQTTTVQDPTDVFSTFRLVVPDWLFQQQNVSSYGRKINPPSRYPM